MLAKVRNFAEIAAGFFRLSVKQNIHISLLVCKMIVSRRFIQQTCRRMWRTPERNMGATDGLKFVEVDTPTDTDPKNTVETVERNDEPSEEEQTFGSEDLYFDRGIGFSGETMSSSGIHSYIEQFPCKYLADMHEVGDFAQRDPLDSLDLSCFANLSHEQKERVYNEAASLFCSSKPSFTAVKAKLVQDVEKLTESSSASEFEQVKKQLDSLKKRRKVFSKCSSDTTLNIVLPFLESKDEMAPRQYSQRQHSRMRLKTGFLGGDEIEFFDEVDDMAHRQYSWDDSAATCLPSEVEEVD